MITIATKWNENTTIDIGEHITGSIEVIVKLHDDVAIHHSPHIYHATTNYQAAQ